MSTKAHTAKKSTTKIPAAPESATRVRAARAEAPEFSEDEIAAEAETLGGTREMQLESLRRRREDAKIVHIETTVGQRLETWRHLLEIRSTFTSVLETHMPSIALAMFNIERETTTEDVSTQLMDEFELLRSALFEVMTEIESEVPRLEAVEATFADVAADADDGEPS